jgi:hypothetical protein
MKTKFNAANVTNVNVTTDWANRYNALAYYQTGTLQEFDGYQQGKDVQHDTIPWYVLGDAKLEIQAP